VGDANADRFKHIGHDCSPPFPENQQKRLALRGHEPAPDLIMEGPLMSRTERRADSPGARKGTRPQTGR
jgi:hypothetical protein